MAENSLNQVQLSGRIGTDLEIKDVANGKKVLNFRLGVNNTGERDTEWFDVTAWDKTAEILAKYRKKGDYILITGKLKQQSWLDKETGEKRYRVRIEIRENILVPSGGQRMSTARHDQGEVDDPPPPRERAQSQPQPEEEDEIPF